MEKALIIIDYIYDFVADDGRLTCGQPGQEIEKNIVKLIEEFKDENQLIVTASFNESGHLFALNHFENTLAAKVI